MNAQPQRIEPAGDPVDGEQPEQLFACSTHGEYRGRKEVIILSGRRMEFEPTCPICEGEKVAAERRQQVEREAEARRAREEVRLNELGVPLRFRAATLDNYEVTEGKEQESALRVMRRYCERFDTRKKVGGGLILIGRQGTGKTYLMCAATLLLASRCQPHYTDAWRMLSAIKGSWQKTRDGRPKDDEAAVIARYVAPDLLLIDEIGVQYGTDAERALLHRVIDLRYQQLKPTIAAGNVDLDGMKAYLGERAVSRLQDGGGVVVNFGWADRRQK